MKSSILQFLKDTFVPVKGKTELTTRVHASEEDSEGGTKATAGKAKEDSVEIDDTDTSTMIVSHLSRRLSRRQIELIAIGGTIGVALYVNIGTSLMNGGALSLLLGFGLWTIPMVEITSCCAEMVCYLPLPGAPFCIFADRFVDEALGVMSSWNFWVLQCAMIPFELTLFNSLIHYWADNYSPAICFSTQLVAYLVINVAAVRWYGEAEFWLCMGKVVLAVMLMVFTFVVMLGGNPVHDRFGFRNWVSGYDTAPMLEYISTGPLGRFQGFLACLIAAAYMMAGPEYLSMAAGETRDPRRVLPPAFKSVFLRLLVFFIGGTLCVGILCNARDPLLLNAISSGKPGAGASPYTIAMYNLHIGVFPHVVNALLVTSAFSAGNSYTFCSSRTLYGMAVQHRAPGVFRRCNRQGVPILAVLVSLAWGALAFLQLSESASTVLNWIINLITASQLMNYCIILFTYLHFRRAVRAQSLDRAKFGFKAIWQPYACIFTLCIVLCMVGVQGYTVFLPGGDWWSVQTFLFSYLMCFIDAAIFIGWKLVRRTRYHRDPRQVDLVSGLDEIERHEQLLKEEAVQGS